MRKRLKIGIGAVASLGALALGGSAIAVATQSGSSAQTKATVSTALQDQASEAGADNVQQGDQATPDNSAGGPSESAGGQADTTSASDQSTTGTNEQADTGSATEQQSSESDGPGGHEDPSGDVEFQSESQE